MQVLLANPRGFCAGVDRAIEIVERALVLHGAPIYVRHEVVHNKFVVNDLRNKGAVFVEELTEVPAGSTVIFSAHGVSQDVRREADARGLKVFDATCPLVTKVHLEAVRFARQGYTIVLIGHHGHDEVIGTMGEAPERIVLVETPEDVAQLSFPAETRLAYLTQTTLSVSEAQRVISSLKVRFPEIVGPPKEDICYATTNRQEAVGVLAPQADVVIVLGSQNSSNSQRLKEIAREIGKPAYLIDTVKELQRDWLRDARTVLITAGASAPEVVVQECVDFLRGEYGAEVEEITIREEDVHFQLPRELKVLQLQT